MNDTVKNSSKSLDDLLNAGVVKMPVSSKTAPKPIGTKQDDLPHIPPPKNKAAQQKPKVTAPPRKPSVLLMNGDTTGIYRSLSQGRGFPVILMLQLQMNATKDIRLEFRNLRW